MANKLYTTPIVCKGKREWFVFFRFWDQQAAKYVPKKIARGNGTDLNRIKDLKEREREFKALREAREIWLKQGWNPLTDPEFKLSSLAQTSSQLSDIATWPVAKALNHALEHKRLAAVSKHDYKKSVEYFLMAAGDIHIDYLPVQRLTRTLIKAVFTKLLEKYKLSNKNYNKRLTHIKSILTELIEWQAIESNPAYGIKELPVEHTKKFIPYTEDEKVMIGEYLFVNNYRFYIYFLTIYFTGIRPAEICSLRVKDFDKKNGLLHLQPFSNVVKNKKERWAVMNKNLMHFYSTMELEKLNADWFIFSENFMPGPKQVSNRRATNLWNKLVVHELGINKYMYAAKHSGADALIRAGVDESDVVNHLGHSSKFMTRRYTELGIANSMNVIRNTSIEF